MDKFNVSSVHVHIVIILDWKMAAVISISLLTRLFK